MNFKRWMLGGGLVLALAGCTEKKPAPPAPAPKAEAPAAVPGEGVEAQSPAGPASIVIPTFAISAAAADIAKGKEIFAAQGCIACHKVGGGKLVGPDLQGVLARRTQSWVEKMVLKPEVMIARDDVAKGMYRTILVPMANQNVDPANELPFIVSYLKSESLKPITEAKN